ncbi:MAG: protein kinase [Deltaproteobacteria bacterium]|nr:protein kinase [Deltaproteobacteria bacterium]
MMELLHSAQQFWENLILHLFRGVIAEESVRFVASPFFLGFCLLMLMGGGGYLIFLRTKAGIRWHRSRSELRKARLFARAGRYEEAGNHYIQAGMPDMALKVFEQGEVFHRIADLKMVDGYLLEAAKFYEKGRRFRQAAELFKETGRYLQAGDCYQQIDMNEQAAEMYELAGEMRKAAVSYEKAHNFSRAQQIYLDAKDYASAGGILARYYHSRVGNFSSSQSITPELKNIALQGGRLFMLGGRFREAAEIFAAGFWHREAGGAYIKCRDIKNAISQYVKGQALEEAASLYEQSGNKTMASRFRAKLCITKGEYSEAAEYLENIQDYEKAADLYKKEQNWSKAADMLRKVGDFWQSADMYSLAEEYDKAAELYERVGRHGEAQRMLELVDDPEKAISFLVREENYLDAAIHLIKHKKIDRAIECLQKIKKGHKDYFQSLRLLGELFVEKGQIGLAVRKFYEGHRNEMNEDNLDSYYEFALHLEENGENDQALKIYEAILGVDMKFPGVHDKIESLRQKTILGKTVIFNRDKTVYLESDPTRPVGLGENRYQILQELGRGGMGVVYKARDLILKRDVAFKIISENLRSNRRAVDDFYREAQATAALNHPFLLTLYDIGEKDGYLYIIMEYVEGKDFEQFIRTGKLLAINTIVKLFRWVCEGLHHAHQKGVIHRDIKPSNIMWTRLKQIKIMDFGLAVLLSELRKSGVMAAGTPQYMSPEQIISGDIDHRTDLYSLGVTIFRMCTGKLPFSGSLEEIMLQHLNAAPPAAHEVNPRVPRSLSDIIFRCMQKKANDRYADAGEVIADLTKLSMH